MITEYLQPTNWIMPYQICQRMSMYKNLKLLKSLLVVHLCILVYRVESHLGQPGQVFEASRLFWDFVLDGGDQLGDVGVPAELGQHPRVVEQEEEEAGQEDCSNQNLGYGHLALSQPEFDDE